MNAIALTPQPPGTGSTDPKHLRKIADAARDFEAVLLNMLIKSLEESFSALPGGDRPVGSESYRDFESEALAASRASAWKSRHQLLPRDKPEPSESKRLGQSVPP